MVPHITIEIVVLKNSLEARAQFILKINQNSCQERLMMHYLDWLINIAAKLQHIVVPCHCTFSNNVYTFRQCNLTTAVKLFDAQSYRIPRLTLCCRK